MDGSPFELAYLGHRWWYGWNHGRETAGVSNGKFIGDVIRGVISPSMRFELRQAAARVTTRLSFCRPWGWELARLGSMDGSPFELAYLGHRWHRAYVCEILGIPDDVRPGRPDLRSPRVALLSELPWRGALKLPRRIHMIVPLGRPIGDIVGAYDRTLRRLLRKLRAECRREPVTVDSEIDRLNREMLAPYAIARHGAGAVRYSDDEIRRMAKRYGRLDLTYRNEEELGCRIGFSLTHRGKKYWIERWFGYPESVFSDEGALREANAINSFLSIEWAIENGYDFYDMGGCVPRPEDGNLQWKRRRGGSVDTLENLGFYYLRPPLEDRPRFFWEFPSFAIERGRVTLHLGAVRGASGDEIVLRFREMGFPGIAKVYLHCHEPPAEPVIAALCRRSAWHAEPPRFEAVLDG